MNGVAVEKEAVYEPLGANEDNSFGLGNLAGTLDMVCALLAYEAHLVATRSAVSLDASRGSATTKDVFDKKEQSC